MSASTAARESSRKVGDIVNYALGAVKVNKGTLVVLRADGYLYPLAAPSTGRAADVFVGVAYETVDNSAGVAGALYCRVQKSGVHRFAKGTAAITDLPVAMYGADDQTISATTTNAVLVGYPTELIDSGTLAIRIDNAVK